MMTQAIYAEEIRAEREKTLREIEDEIAARLGELLDELSADDMRKARKSINFLAAIFERSCPEAVVNSFLEDAREYAKEYLAMCAEDLRDDEEQRRRSEFEEWLAEEAMGE